MFHIFVLIYDINEFKSHKINNNNNNNNNNNKKLNIYSSQ